MSRNSDFFSSRTRGDVFANLEETSSYIGTAPWCFSPALDAPRPIERTDLTTNSLIERWEQPKTGEPGSKTCPCIDPWEVGITGRGDKGCEMQRHSDGTCYDKSYGAKGCQQYDLLKTKECKTDKPPAWCVKRFCYVDPDNCQGVDTSQSQFFPHMFVKTGRGRTPLTYSYDTCGATKVSTSPRISSFPAEIELVTNPPLAVMMLKPWTRGIQEQRAFRR